MQQLLLPMDINRQMLRIISPPTTTRTIIQTWLTIRLRKNASCQFYSMKRWQRFWPVRLDSLLNHIRIRHRNTIECKRRIHQLVSQLSPCSFFCLFELRLPFHKAIRTRQITMAIQINLSIKAIMTGTQLPSKNSENNDRVSCHPLTLWITTTRSRSRVTAAELCQFDWKMVIRIWTMDPFHNHQRSFKSKSNCSCCALKTSRTLEFSTQSVQVKLNDFKFIGYFLSSDVEMKILRFNFVSFYVFWKIKTRAFRPVAIID